MSFLEYIVMFDKIKKDNDVLFMVSENNYSDYKIGDIVIVSDFNYKNINSNIFVIIDDNNLSVPIDFLHYIDSNLKNVDFVYQIDDKKIIKKIGKINPVVITDYKKKYILLNRNQTVIVFFLFYYISFLAFFKILML